MTGRKPFWIASYPKSGNTWVRCLIVSLANGGAPPELSRMVTWCPYSADRMWLERVTEIPTDELTFDEVTALRRSAHHALAAGDPLARLAAPHLIAIKVHDCYDPFLFAPAISAGAVYIVRDPRDVAPSWAQHAGYTLPQAIDEMAQTGKILGRHEGRLVTAAVQMFGSWSQNVTSWLDGFGEPLCLLRYEDLLARPHAEVARLAAFLNLPADEKTVAAAVENCRFDVLRDVESRDGFIEKGKHQERFFRRGRAGAWTEDLSAEQAEAILCAHRPVMARLGYLAGTDGAPAPMPVVGPQIGQA